jgi:hypothetical protein
MQARAGASVVGIISVPGWGCLENLQHVGGVASDRYSTQHCK